MKYEISYEMTKYYTSNIKKKKWKEKTKTKLNLNLGED